MRRLMILAALLAVGLAGCSKDAASTGGDDEALFDDAETLTTGKGAIRGVVVDPSIAPVPDAVVVLVGSDAQTVTDENGAFRIVDVEPGNHFLEVSKPGWTTVQQSTAVEAGVERPPILKILLERRPGAEPRAETFTVEGFIQCGAGTPLTIHECPGLNDQDKSQVTIPFAGGPQHLQAEVLWESTQPAGEQLYLIVKTCGDPCDWGFDGRFSEGVMDSPHVARTQGNFTAGNLGVWASPGGPANGTGVALDQAFMVYGTFFHNIDDPVEDWTFHEDGAYPA